MMSSLISSTQSSFTLPYPIVITVFIKHVLNLESTDIRAIIPMACTISSTNPIAYRNMTIHPLKHFLSSLNNKPYAHVQDSPILSHFISLKKLLTSILLSPPPILLKNK